MSQATLPLFQTTSVFSDQTPALSKKSILERRNILTSRNSSGLSFPSGYVSEGTLQFQRDKLFRSVIKRECSPFSNPGVDGILHKRLSACIKQMRDVDKTHQMGAKTVIGRQIHTLDGFELNQKYPLRNVLTHMPMTFSRYGLNDIGVEIKSGDSWQNELFDGYILYIHEFCVDANYQIVHSRKFSSEPVPKNERSFSIAYERETSPSNQYNTILMVGVQSFYEDERGINLLTSGNALRARLFVIG